MGIYTRPHSINDGLPHTFNAAADLSALFELGSQTREEQTDTARLENDTAENLYTLPA